ncbi:hypothetical protein ES319_D10G071400v1, partial [Gossypium barbadense]
SLIPSFFGNQQSNIFNRFAINKETSNAHVFKVNLPGLKKEEIKYERVIQISGKRNVRRKRRTRFKASMENGVLIVIVPKVEVKKLDVKAI